MSLWLPVWLCALDNDLLLLPFLSVILKMYKYRCLYFCVIILPFSVSNIQKCHICKVYIIASQAYNAPVTKPVTRTLGPNRPRKTGSRYNDIHSCVGKSKESVTMSQHSCLIPLLTVRFSAETALRGSFTPVAGIRVEMNKSVQMNAMSHE